MDEAQESSATPDRSSPSPKLGRRSSKPDQPRAEPDDRSVGPRSDRPARNYVTVTIDADSAQVVRVDGVDATGVARELTIDERVALLKDLSHERLQDVVEQAFEAGIACVLGGDDFNTTAESPEESALRHRLLAPLIERSAVGRLMERGALNRAVLNTLITRDTT